MQKLFRVKVSLVDIPILPSIVAVDVLTLLSTTMMYGAKWAMLFLGMFTILIFDKLSCHSLI